MGTIQGGAAYSIAPDHLGAPYKIVNSANAQVWFWDHDPFGNGAPTAAAGFWHRLRFPGQVYDSESKLHSNGHRDYDPRLGRYLESDPIGLEGGINTYAYANNNPVNSVDPTGTIVTPETLWDLGNVAMGVYSLFDNYRNGKYLARHLGYAEKYGQGGVKELQNGRIRYYGDVQPASKAGDMAGRRYVHEFDPASGRSRGWHETVDHSGQVRQVRPAFEDEIKKHYMFDSDGDYSGRW